MAKQRQGLFYYLWRLGFGLKEQFLGLMFIYPEEIDGQKLSKWQRMFVSSEIWRSRKQRPDYAPADHIKTVLLVVFFLPLEILSYKIIVPIFALFGFLGNSAAFPSLDKLAKLTPRTHRVSLSDRQLSKCFEPGYEGLSMAEFVCQCDGHRLLLNAMSFKFIFSVGVFSLTPLVAGYFFYMGQHWLGAMTVVLALTYLWLPSRAGIVFDRDHQTVMLLRGWLRKPLVVPFNAIMFSHYLEGGANMGRDIIVYSTEVPKGRKRPIRMVMNTGMGSSSFSMQTIANAIHVFMDKDNTRAMASTVKERIEWCRKHQLTLWHYCWRPLPQSDAATYQQPDSLYQSDLLEPGSREFNEHLLPEGRALMAKEELLTTYLDTLWETLDPSQLPETLVQQVTEQIHETDIKEAIIKRLKNERFSACDVHDAIDHLSHLPVHRQLYRSYMDVMMSEKENLAQAFVHLRECHDIKLEIYHSGYISREQFLESFPYGLPKRIRATYEEYEPLLADE